MSVPSGRFTEEQFNKFTAVDSYFNSELLPKDPHFEATQKVNAEKGLDEIDVAPNQGKLLYLLAKMNRAKRILEVGTLGGYSALWFAKAVGKEGKVITCEIDPETAAVAKHNTSSAGFGDVVEVKVGPALETLEKMGKETIEPFDMVFIDADKENNANYLSWALKFSRVGTLIVIDNVVRRGRIVAELDDPQVIGTRKMFADIKANKRLEATAVQTVGSKGWDGFCACLVIE